jgi:hypothetical protein
MPKKAKHDTQGPEASPDAIQAPEAVNTPSVAEVEQGEASGLPRKEIIRNTPSEAARQIALELVLLRLFASDDIAKSACYSVKVISNLLYAFHETGKDCIAKFASCGEVTDSVNIRGRLYPSGHHAALREATSFIDRLWFHLDQLGREEAVKRFRDFPNDSKENLRILNGFKGFDAKLVEANWERAKAGILELLNDSWDVDFKGIESRIERERALAEPVEGSRGGKQSGNKHAYLVAELARELVISSRTLNHYAKAAGVTTPGRGKKNHKYSFEDRSAILEYVNEHVTEQAIAQRARDLMGSEIETKSINRN